MHASGGECPFSYPCKKIDIHNSSDSYYSYMNPQNGKHQFYSGR